MISLSQLGVRASRGEIIAALCAGVAETLTAEFSRGSLSEDEAQLAWTLEQEKYTRTDWNLRGKQADSTAQS
jgi:lipoate-protein ligase A